MNPSVIGYVVGSDGGFDWSLPDEEVFRAHPEEIRGVGVHLVGRRLYETMLYWQTADQDPSLDDAEREWAALWKRLPKGSSPRRCRGRRAGSDRRVPRVPPSRPGRRRHPVLPAAGAPGGAAAHRKPHLRSGVVRLRYRMTR